MYVFYFNNMQLYTVAHPHTNTIKRNGVVFVCGFVELHTCDYIVMHARICTLYMHSYMCMHTYMHTPEYSLLGIPIHM